MLKCVSSYRSSLGTFHPGDVVDDAALEAALLSDSFASFEAVIIEAKQAEDVEDKMVRKGRAK